MIPLKTHKIVLIYFLILSISFCAQNENRKWYFGSNAALDFNGASVTPIMNSVMGAPSACTSISDQNGNLLFYIHSSTIWTQNNVVMPNGSISGNPGLSQSVLALKKPGSSTLYYAFALNFSSSGTGLLYYVIDMSLAGGTGSVVSNTYMTVPNHVYSSEKITATKHCNDVDYWVVVHPKDKPEFYSYLISSTGVSNSPVVSQVGQDTISGPGYMKISPTGKKIALIGKRGDVIIHDFDKSTGAVSSNSVVLTGTNNAYGLEFSPDGTKLYMSTGKIGNTLLWQWDLCASNGSAINNSKQIIFAANNTQNGALLLGPNGKIYKARNGVDTLGVINNPNAAGVNCNYQNSGQSLGGNGSGSGLPNQVAKTFKPQVTINATLNCQNVLFSSGSTGQCTALLVNPNYYVWDFGEPLSGSANSSTLSNPSHTYSSTGSFTAILIQYYNCYIDTIYKTIQVSNSNPTINISGSSTICAGEKLTLNASGNGILSYQWNTGNTSNTLAIVPTTNTAYIVNGTNAQGCVATKSINIQVNKCLSIKSNSEIPNFCLYPNPNLGEFVLNTDAKKINEIRIISLIGEEVNILTHQFNDSLIRIDLKSANPGIYILKIRTEDAIYYKQIIKAQ
ncbi:MAG: T9SS type A sorting domain-containing protein [Bacteroidota bacterium]